MTQKYDLSLDDLDRVFKTVDIPTRPTIVTEVMAEAQKDMPDMSKLAKTIAADVGAAAIAIKLANSPLFRCGVPVGNVRHALERLGTRNVVCLVVTMALRASVSGGPSAWLEKFWDRTAALAMASGLLAHRLYGISPDTAYTYAMFHDAAIPLMMRRFPNYAQQVEEGRRSGKTRFEAEEQFFPCTHPIIGSLLIRNWGLPPLIGQAIRFHHEPDVYDLPDGVLPGVALSLMAVTHVAEHLAADLLDGADLDVGTALFDRAVAHLGISVGELDEFREELLSALNAA